MKPDGETAEIQVSSANSQGFHGNLLTTIRNRAGPSRDDAGLLSLNVLLLGDRQSGRSSVGNALIGSDEFQTGPGVSGVSGVPGVSGVSGVSGVYGVYGGPAASECRVLSRTIRSFFRRSGAECDLRLAVMDTPPLPRPTGLGRSVRLQFTEGVHVLVLVVRADMPRADTQLVRCAQTLFGPEWFQHALLVLTHADCLEEAGLDPTRYLAGTSNWLRALAAKVGGGVLFIDNGSDWPMYRGAPLRERVLSLSAARHHSALRAAVEADSA